MNLNDLLLWMAISSIRLGKHYSMRQIHSWKLGIIADLSIPGNVPIRYTSVVKDDNHRTRGVFQCYSDDTSGKVRVSIW